MLSGHRIVGHTRRGTSSGFTLVELLVVIGIIALLISMLMPSLRRAREHANAVNCSSNMRQLMMAFLMFANEHNNHLPGNWYGNNDPDFDKRDWLAGDVLNPAATAPEGGTVYRYTNKTRDLYRCPSLIHDPNTAAGSNGNFDYTVYMLWGGAKVQKIKPTSRFRHTDGTLEPVPTPILVEEDLSFINWNYIDGNHCNIDPMAHTHFKGGFMASVDGSVHWFLEPIGQNSWSWETQAPSGTWTTMGISVPWGTFNGL